VDFSCDLSNELNDGTQALLTATVLTDDNGSAAVDLIPGTGNYNRGYTVAVTPPANSPFQRADQLALMLGPQGGVLAPVSLGLRPQVVGHLVSPGGDPVAGAVVSAQPSGQAVQLGAQDPNPLALPSALSGPDGGFSVRVDPGTYDVDLVPPAAQPLPRWSLDNRVVSTSDVDLQTVPLPMAVRARVTVLDPAGAAVDGLEMRIYSLSWPSDCPMKMQTGSCPALPARLAADAVTASDGSAQVYLPAP
jgi:hypothetical protein